MRVDGVVQGGAILLCTFGTLIALFIGVFTPVTLSDTPPGKLAAASCSVRTFEPVLNRKFVVRLQVICLYPLPI